MKRIFLTFFCGALVMLTAPSCSKDEGSVLQTSVEQTTGDIPLADEKSNAPIEQVISDTSSADVNNAPVAKVWHVTLKAKTASNGISKALKAVDSDNKFGYTLKGEFSKDEVVYVLKDEEPVGTLTAKHTGEWITFDGTFATVENLNQNDELELRSPNVDFSYDGQDGTIESACNHYYAKATVKVTEIIGDNVTVEDALFEFCSSMVKFTLNKQVDKVEISDGSTPVTVTSASATKEIYVSLPPVSSATEYTISATKGTDTYEVTKTYNIATNKYYTATVKYDILDGVFSVSDTKKVKFSKGNLQYHCKNQEWRFAENQWDFIGSANKNISADYDGYIDLFGWGMWLSGQTPTNASKSSADYLSSVTSGEFSGVSAFGSEWTTLTSDEWTYLFNTRTTTSEVRYAKATVNGVGGVILLPDNWSTETYSLQNTNSNSTSAAFTTNTIDATTWSNLEAAGAVFLPAAGIRDEVSVRHADTDGLYWSGTASGASNAFNVGFSSGGLTPAGNWSRYYGFSVRPVRVQN